MSGRGIGISKVQPRSCRGGNTVLRRLVGMDLLIGSSRLQLEDRG